MVKDRLSELRAKSKEAEEEEKKGKYSKVDTMGDPLSNLLSKVSDFDEKISKLRKDVDEMNKLQKNLSTRPRFDQNEFKKEVRDMEKLSDQIFSTSTELQKEVNDFSKKIFESDLSGTQAKMMNMHATRLSGEITNLLNDFRAVQVDHIKNTEKIHKATNLIGNEAENSVSENNVELDFGMGFMKEAQKARLESNELQARDDKIKKLKGKVTEVNQLFKEINAVIMEQGETIAIIAKEVSVASVAVEAGKKQINKRTEKSHKKKISKHRNCCCSCSLFFNK